MIVRKLRENEKYKCTALMSAAFNFSADIEEEKKNILQEESVGAFCDDNETLMGQIVAKDYRTFFNGKELGALGIAGVSTFPQYRRANCIRECFKYLFDNSENRGWSVSYLYPFSYDFYRQFGYERMFIDSSVTFPISSLEKISRNSYGILYTDKAQLSALCDIYNSIASGINGMLKRSSAALWCDSPFKSRNYTYYFNNNGLLGYCVIGIEGDTLYVKELLSKDVKTSAAILGFLRLYDGQVSKICINNIQQNSPTEYLLGEFRRLSRGAGDGPMARVLDVEAVLKTKGYPEKEGSFTIQVEDKYIEKNNRCFRVNYMNGVADSVEPFLTGNADIRCDIRTFTMLAFGTAQYSIDAWTNLFNASFSDKFISAPSLLTDIFPLTKINLIDKF